MSCRSDPLWHLETFIHLTPARLTAAQPHSRTTTCAISLEFALARHPCNPSRSHETFVWSHLKALTLANDDEVFPRSELGHACFIKSNRSSSHFVCDLDSILVALTPFPANPKTSPKATATPGDNKLVTRVMQTPRNGAMRQICWSAN